MITLQNMIFANPQAYQVFPNMVNPYNTGTTELARYTGYLIITDNDGNTYSFTNTSAIDFTPISGLVTIDNVTDRGSAQLGRWRIPQSIIITNDITVTVTPIDEVSSDGATITPQYVVKYNTYSNGELSESIVVTPDNVTLQTNVQWITVNNDQIVVSANTNTEARQGQVTIRVQYQEYSAIANYNIVQAGYDIEQDIMQSMVLWYDIAKQDATNDSMKTSPILKDLSGNGHDATCYNFAWTEESGISTTEYPGALVSDGVDDYCLVEGLPLLNKEDGYTVIAKRKWIEIPTQTSALSSKRDIDNSINGAFQFEYITQNRQLELNFGNSTSIDFIQEDISWMTSQQYNNISIKIGTSEDSDIMQLFRSIRTAFCTKIALYSFLTFNRDLSTDEIEWVKTNLIEVEQ